MLAALLGSAAVDSPAMAALAPLLVVFGLQRITTRFFLRRLGFAHALACSRWRHGDRAKLVDFFDAACVDLPGFDAASVTGATRRAILEGARLTKAGELGNEDQPGVTEYWPDYRNVDKKGWRFLCRRAAAKKAFEGTFTDGF